MNRIIIATTAALLLATTAQAKGQDGRHAFNADANNDGKVTLAEFKAAMAQRQDRLFARLDANKDGKISQAEIDAAPKRGKAAGHKGGMIARLDADKDGAVSKAEMAAVADRRFQMADANKDGWLSTEELAMMRQRRGGAGAK